MPKEFDSILGYIAAINKISGGEKELSHSIVAQVNVMREDTDAEESGIHTEALLSLAPEREGQYVKVKKIL